MMDVNLSYGDLGTQPLASVVKNPALVRSLNLSGNNIDKELSIEIANTYISCMVNLEELDLKDNKIGPQGAKHLCDTLLKHCSKLKYLDLNENGILDESLLYVAYLLQEKRMESLFLVSNHLTQRGMPTLCDGILSSRHIRELTLAFNVLGDGGASVVAKALRGHPSLRSLDISDNRIGDAGAVDVAAHLILPRESRLESLNLSVNCIRDVGFSAISEAVRNTQSRRLIHLDLGGNHEVGSDGRGALIKCMESMRHLQSLDLCSCGLSDEEGWGLVGAVSSRNCGITAIEWFNNPKMRPETEKALYEALKAKRAAARDAEQHWRQLKIFSSVLLGATLLTGLTVAFHQRRHR
ncbi:Leucine-rich repeat, ribonuclease inhibitor subtype domain-containing protein [Trypanosoma cruzi]|nr:Leucine-rich repeat, ribonuclease inhibitor subtype domain-containing protein [Trypanosoma cruzi]